MYYFFIHYSLVTFENNYLFISLNFMQLFMKMFANSLPASQAFMLCIFYFNNGPFVIIRLALQIFIHVAINNYSRCDKQYVTPRIAASSINSDALIWTLPHGHQAYCATFCCMYGMISSLLLRMPPPNTTTS